MRAVQDDESVSHGLRAASVSWQSSFHALNMPPLAAIATTFGHCLLHIDPDEQSLAVRACGLGMPLGCDCDDNLQCVWL